VLDYVSKLLVPRYLKQAADEKDESGSKLLFLTNCNFVFRSYDISMRSSVFCDIMPCNPLRVIRVSEEHVASIFMVEEYAEQETCLKQVASFPFNPEDGDDILLRSVD
jgi:hypothetical protein